MKNIEEQRQAEYGAVRALLQDLAQVQGMEALVARRESMRTLQEKFAFLCYSHQLGQGMAAPPSVSTSGPVASAPLTENFSRNPTPPSPQASVQVSASPAKEISMTAAQRDALVRYLFDGDAGAFGAALAKLGRLHSRAEANRYLSDLYYERDWKRVESHAQSFWQMVEKSFPV